MPYQTYPTSSHLAPLVKCFWSLEFSATPQPEKQTIIPDDCMELIIHYGDLYQQFHQDGSSFVPPRSFMLITSNFPHSLLVQISNVVFLQFQVLVFKHFYSL